MINHLMYMDDIKIFAKNGKEFESLIKTIRIFSEDIVMLMKKNEKDKH